MLTLLLGLVCSCATTPVVKPPEGPFFVTSEITYLLDRPGYGGNVLGPLYRGDKVEIVDAGESAWWRVELQRSGQTGWVRKEVLSPNPVATVFYFVKEDTLSLRECPRSDCMPLQLLSRGDEVQRVEAGDQGWWRVLVINSRSLGLGAGRGPGGTPRRCSAKATPQTILLCGSKKTRSCGPNHRIAPRSLELWALTIRWKKSGKPRVGLTFANLPAARWAGSSAVIWILSP